MRIRRLGLVVTAIVLAACAAPTEDGAESSAGAFSKSNDPLRVMFTKATCEAATSDYQPNDYPSTCKYLCATSAKDWHRTVELGPKGYGEASKQPGAGVRCLGEYVGADARVVRDKFTLTPSGAITYKVSRSFERAKSSPSLASALQELVDRDTSERLNGGSFLVGNDPSD